MMGSEPGGGRPQRRSSHPQNNPSNRNRANNQRRGGVTSGAVSVRVQQQNAHGQRVHYQGHHSFEPQLQSPQTRIKQQIPVIPAIVAVAILVAVIIGIGSLTHPKDEAAAKVETGVSYIKQMEGEDSSQLAAEIRKVRMDKQAANVEAGNDAAIWGMFDNAVIMGDSRAVGFSYYNFLSENQVLADAGLTIADIPEYETQLKAINPSRIFLCFGLNDISIGYWNNSDEYTKSLGEKIAWLKEVCPNATIYVNSTLPACDPAFDREEKWRDIPEWNVAVKAYCEANGIPYIDNSQLAEEHADYWNDDGIHMSSYFYPFWAEDMIEAMSSHD